MSWFDTHCHLHSFLKTEELEAVLERTKQAGVNKMVTVGTSPEDWNDYQILSERNPDRIDYSAGLHPGYVDQNWEAKLSGLSGCWGKAKDPVALGEIGLDYFRLPKDQREAEKIIFWQKEAFRKQLGLAREINCPVIIHSRSAFDDCVYEIDESGVNWEKVVFHCFTEGVDQISQLIERGGRASFTGIITFPKNEKLLNAIKHQGLEKLMLETDSPYLAPVPYRGKRNEPCYIPEIGKFVKSLFSQDIEPIIWENSFQFYYS